MATAPVAAAAPDEVVCPVCHETYGGLADARRPVAPACGHPLCAECCAGLAARAGLAGPRCPLCRGPAVPTPPPAWPVVAARLRGADAGALEAELRAALAHGAATAAAEAAALRERVRLLEIATSRDALRQRRANERAALLHKYHDTLFRYRNNEDILQLMDAVTAPVDDDVPAGKRPRPGGAP